MQLKKPPTDREIYEGELATYWMDDGFLVSLSKRPRRTVENITGNRKALLFIYLNNSPVPDKETSDFVNKVLPQMHSAMAIVLHPGLENLYWTSYSS
jgi:hypothetical protein